MPPSVWAHHASVRFGPTRVIVAPRGTMLAMIGRLDTVVIDCPDPDCRVSFQLVPDLQPPQWPDPQHPQQFHLDVEVDDIEAAEPKVLALGAQRLHDEPKGFRVYADPAGHPFCLVFDA